MRKLVSTVGLDYNDWLSYRAKSIGGSDCAAICGLSKFKSAYSLWAEKKGFLPNAKEDSEIMRQGRDLEDYVAKRFCEATGKKVKRRNYIFLHDKYEFISANIDREVVGENAGLECKTTSVYNKSDFENGEIPEYYYCQCMHYMAVMGYEKMYLAVLVLSKGFYWFEIRRDEKEISALIELETDFWNKYVLGDEIPEIDGSDSTYNAINSIQNNTKSNIKNSIEMDTILKEYEKLSSQKKFIESKEKALKNSIIAYMGADSLFRTKGFDVSYKPQKRNSIDTAKLKKELPEIFKKYQKETEHKVLRIKTM